jgi:hypothetical protein
MMMGADAPIPLVAMPDAASKNLMVLLILMVR